MRKYITYVFVLFACTNYDHALLLAAPDSRIDLDKSGSVEVFSHNDGTSIKLELIDGQTTVSFSAEVSENEYVTRLIYLENGLLKESIRFQSKDATWEMIDGDGDGVPEMRVDIDTTKSEIKTTKLNLTANPTCCEPSKQK